MAGYYWFLEWKLLYFDSNFIAVCSKGTNWQSVSTGSSIAWCWIGDKPSLPEPMTANVFWHHMASLGNNELNWCWLIVVWPMGISSGKILIKIQEISFNKMNLKIASTTGNHVGSGFMTTNIVCHGRPCWFRSHDQKCHLPWAAMLFQASWPQINGLVRERHNSIANALELRLSCTYPSKCCMPWAAMLVQASWPQM